MNLPDVSVVLDIVIAVLLVVMIYYAVMLNRSLSTLKKSKEELQSLLGGFEESTVKAEMAINRIKVEATDNSVSVKELIREADRLREDLQFLVDRGEGVADKLEGGITRNRKGAVAETTAAQDRKPAPLRASKPLASSYSGDAETGQDSGESGGEDAGKKLKSRSKSDLLKALQGMR
ncbi:MAG: DUF6468 domain-containing protein [Alphaproteobacteria bacterium]